MIKKLLDKVSDKLSAPWDYDQVLIWLWDHEGQRSPEVYE